MACSAGVPQGVGLQQYFDTKLHGILPWADINGNGNTFFHAENDSEKKAPFEVQNVKFS